MLNINWFANINGDKIMQAIKKRSLYVIPITLSILMCSCKKDLTPVDNTQPEIKMTVEDVGVTEVWLKLETANSRLNDRITIQRNDSTIKQLNNLNSDTLIYDLGLIPNQYYTYTASLTTDNQTLTAESQITTMDTTSHDFTWQSWTFGAKGSSILYDVAIIDENNIWAVGEIYTEDTYTYDSLGNWIQPYNAIHWDGDEWELKRILFNFQGNPTWSRIKSVYAFNGDDIWFEAGIHWNGTTFQTINLNISFPSHVNKIWGTSSGDLFIVGNDGLIAYYNGQTWQRIESGTQDTFFDIWGIDDSPSNENPVYLSAFDNLYSIDENNRVNNENWAFLDKPIRSVWYNNRYHVFGCGEKIFKKPYTKEWQVIPGTPHDDLYMISLRGQDVNDIFVIGNFGLVLHNNGITWKRFFNQNNNMYWSVSYKDDVMVAVGEIWYSSPHEAIILMMNRN